MTVAGLRISPDLTLPLDAATGTFGVIATKGAGKSNAAVVIAERMYDAGIPWVAVDPKGDWHGLRSSADGKGPGLPVVVFGGRHGDVDLEPTAGVLLADLVLRHRLTCVLDVSQFTKADTTRFLLAFGRHLFRHADDDGAEPLHLFLEEAHEYLPQVVKGDHAELVNVWQRIVKQGRFKGLGCTLISQRSSVLNKDVLELIDTLIVLRTIGPRSRQSIKDWVHDQDVDAGLLASLPGLADGEAWVWSPGALRIMQRIQFDRRRTFDSGATPKVGEKRRLPATVADVDLAAIKEAMAETIERAKADDPKALRARIVELERALADARSRPDPDPVEIPVSVLDDADRALLAQLSQTLQGAQSVLSDVGAILSDKLTELPAGAKEGSRPQRLTSPAQPDRAGTPTPEGNPRPRQERVPVSAGPPDPDLAKSERALLTALVHRGPTLERRSLGAISGYSWKSGGFRNTLSSLRTKGYLDGSDPVSITDRGRGALGHVDQAPTGTELLAFWSARIGKAEKAIAQVLFDAYPHSRTRDEVADACGYSVMSGGFRNALSRLRTLGLIDPGDPLRASDNLGGAS